jgi:hypothetical protein
MGAGLLITDPPVDPTQRTTKRCKAFICDYVSTDYVAPVHYVTRKLDQARTLSN